jgi:hypothetical protein
MRPIVRYGSLFALPALVLAAHLAAARLLNLYALIPNLDMPFHLAGGFSIGYTAGRLLGFLQWEKRIGPVDETAGMALVFSVSAAAAVIWELMEFVMDRLVGTRLQISLANTMQDQFLGLLGGSLAVIAVRTIRRSRVV